MFLLLTGSRGTACAKFVVLIVSVVGAEIELDLGPIFLYASKDKSGTLPQMSALGQKQTCTSQKVMSALPPKADIGAAQINVR
jgi:hypothetical protein